MRKEISIIFIAVIISAIILAGCTGPEEVRHEEGITKLTVGTTMAVNDLNINDYDLGILRGQMTHQGLVKLSPDGGFEPALASSWETSDAKKWTFHLIENATFHDGTPLTAEDIKFNLEYLPGKIAEFKTHWGLIESVETPDNYTLIINLKQPNSNFLVNLLVLRTIPKHVFENVDDPKTFNDMKATTGSGPYMLEKFDKEAGTLTFRAYDGYWGGKPAIDTIEVRMFKNPDTMIMALQKGEVDTTYIYSRGISYYYVPKLLNDEDIKFLMIKNTGVPNALWFNANKTPYDNPEFRKAVSYAIDYDELKNLFTAGYASLPNAGFLPNGSYNYKETGQLANNVNRSIEILDSIGFKDVDGDGYREMPDGGKFQPEILTRTDNSDNIRLSEMIKKYLNTVGIDAKIKLVDKTTTRDILNVKKTHDMAITGTTPWGMMMWVGYGTGYFDSRNIGYSMTSDPKFHSLVDEMLVTSDREKMGQLAFDVQDYYAENMPAIALYWDDLIQPYNAKYDGWVVDPMYGIMSYGTFYGLHKT